MSEGKSTNLLKTAKELNIGLSTAVEFLGKKGYKVEARPNTKLTDEMYDVLLKEFQGDKIVKEEAKQIVIGKIRRDDTPVSNERTEPQHPKEFEQEGKCKFFEIVYLYQVDDFAHYGPAGAPIFVVSLIIVYDLIVALNGWILGFEVEEREEKL